MLAMLQNAQRALEFMYTLPTEKRSWKLQMWLIYVLNVSMSSSLRSVHGLCPVTIFRNIHTSAVGAMRLLKSCNRQIDVFDMKISEITKHSLSKRNNVCLFKAHVTEEHHRLSSYKSVIKLFLLGFSKCQFLFTAKVRTSVAVDANLSLLRFRLTIWQGNFLLYPFIQNTALHCINCYL
jgi:hypothetical protein